MAITIPKQALPGLHKLIQLDSTQFDSFIARLGETKPALTKDQLVAQVCHDLPHLEKSEAATILEAVLPLYWLKESRGLSPQALADELSQAADEVKSKEFQFPPETKVLLRKRIVSLLAFDKSLAVTAKALDVMTEHERVFCGARILSDIRSVFTDSSESASAGLIIHNLQIGFHNADGHQEFYVALDNNDLKQLKSAIARAEQKTKALKAILEKADVPYLEV